MWANIKLLSGAEGGAVIEMTDNTKDIFCIDAYTNKIKYLKFIGGKSHLVFYNQNLDCTVIVIEGCEFQYASSFSLRFTPSGAADHLSALINIKDCRFLNNYQVLESYADSCNIIYCWVTTGDDMCDGVMFSNKAGRLMFENMFGVPMGCANKNSARWVDNYGTFVAFRSRFGAESSGMPIVYNYAGLIETWPYVGGGSIMLESCAIASGADNRAAIKLYEVPQKIIIRDCEQLVADDYIQVDSSLDLDTALDGISSELMYVIEPNPGRGPAGVPEQLRPYINPLRELYGDKPETGHWEQGHALLNKDVNHNSHVGIVNTEAGEPGKWSYWGKTSPFPIGPQAGTIIDGNKGKYTFDIPDSKNFTAMVTISGNPNYNGSGHYFTSHTIMLSVETFWGGTAVKDYVKYASVFAPSTEYPSSPTIESIHFGSGDTGSAERSVTTSGQITIVWSTCTRDPFVSIEPLSVRP